MRDKTSNRSAAGEAFDLNIARIRVHRNNINRYNALLRTKLNEVERAFIDRRLAEERAALDALAAETFPVTFLYRMPRLNTAS